VSDVCDIDAIGGQESWLIDHVLCSHTLAVYLSPHAPGCVSCFGRHLLTEKQLVLASGCVCFASLLCGLYIKELRRSNRL
jgi:hypothetical protein